MITKFDIVLLEKPAADGLTRTNCMDLFDMLKEIEAYPLDIQGHCENAAMGFIGVTASEKLDYDHSRLNTFIQNILDDMDKEQEDCCYKFNNLDIYLSR